MLVVGGAEGVDRLVAGLFRGGWEVTTVVPASVTVAYGRVLTGYHGGAAGLARTIAEGRIEVVVDAAAPFDAELHADTAEAARATGVPMVAYAPPALTGAVNLPDAQAAAAWVARHAHHVLLDCADGVLDPTAFADDSDNLYVLRRAPTQAEAWPPRHRDVPDHVRDQGQKEERAVLRDNQVDAVVLPDTGEAAHQITLAAAESLGVPVVAVARPDVLPSVTVFDSPEDVVRAL
ncbi:precorrin-6A/cobalt-precorrin-6A reductase [Corynebacterium frankenforstense]